MFWLSYESFSILCDVFSQKGSFTVKTAVWNMLSMKKVTCPWSLNRKYYRKQLDQVHTAAMCNIHDDKVQLTWWHKNNDWQTKCVLKMSKQWKSISLSQIRSMSKKIISFIEKNRNGWSVDQHIISIQQMALSNQVFSLEMTHQQRRWSTWKNFEGE